MTKKPGAYGLTAIPGIKVGHAQMQGRPTGCTAILVEDGATAGVDVRGCAPGTRETDLLDPTQTVECVHAIVLAGGSAFGLAAATGVMDFLHARGVGLDVGICRVPIVPAAVLFDLQLGEGHIFPDADCGYRAAQAASGQAVQQGCVGAGTGATVGKVFGTEGAMKSGVGSHGIRLESGLIIASLVAVNAVGDVLDPQTQTPLAGARDLASGKLIHARQALAQGRSPMHLVAQNTTIGVVATNAALSKPQACKMAQAAQVGLARCINPIHTPYDGDTLFGLATGERQEPTDMFLITALAAEVTQAAILSAVRCATSWGEIPCAHAYHQKA